MIHLWKLIPFNLKNWNKNKRFKGDSSISEETETKVILIDTIAAEKLDFLSLGKRAARAAKHLAIKKASNVTRALEFAADSSTADATVNPKTTAATVPLLYYLFTETMDGIYEKHKKHKQT